MRGAIAADDDLLLGVVERIERMKKLGLCAFLARNELNIVDQQDINGSVSLTKIDDPIVPDGIDHLVHEALGRDVCELETSIVLQNVLANCVHQMRFAETDTAVDEQWVVGARGGFGDGAASRV